MSIKGQSTAFGMPPARRFVLDDKGLLVPSSIKGGKAVNLLASVPWVAQWKFNNDGNDSIGANNLTNNNAATFTTGKLGGATGATQLASASNQYWSVSDNAPLSGGDLDLTACAWVYFDTFADWRTILGKNDAVTAREYSLYNTSAPRTFRFSVANTGTGEPGIVADPTVLSLATWYCVIVWHDAVNNVVGISVDDNTPTTAAYTLGSQDSGVAFLIGWDGSAISKFDGRIDNVCIAKSAAGGGGVLTSSQRSAFYAAGVGTEQLT